jgi:hypothetical protein
MDDFEQKVEEQEKQAFKGFTSEDSKIPIPTNVSFLERAPEPRSAGEPLLKHSEVYEKFCRWSALPKSSRKPKTIDMFEKKHNLPKNTTDRFRAREDFRNKRLTYFWDWMMDKFPDIVEAVYERAIRKSTADARIFAEIISHHIDVQKPESRITNFNLIGVPQEDIKKLFIPKGYVDKGDIPKAELVK